MSRLSQVCKTSFVRFLVCANLLFGLLLFRDFLSHGKQESLKYRPAWHPASSESTAAMPEAAHARDQMLQGKEGGRLSQIISSTLSKWAARGSSGNTVMASEEEGSLCDFKEEGLPKQVLLQKLVECYKEITTSSAKEDQLEYADYRMDPDQITHFSNRRLLREVSHKSKEERVVKKFNNIAPFHLDYSGPQTHPPKNN